MNKSLEIPTIGIGAGADTDGQILVWTDFAGLSGGKPRKFVRRYAELAAELASAASAYVADVQAKDFPNVSESFE